MLKSHKTMQEAGNTRHSCAPSPHTRTPLVLPAAAAAPTSLCSISAASLALSSCSLSHSPSFSARFFAARAAGCLSMFRLLSGLFFFNGVRKCVRSIKTGATKSSREVWGKIKTRCAEAETGRTGCATWCCREEWHEVVSARVDGHDEILLLLLGTTPPLAANNNDEGTTEQEEIKGGKNKSKGHITRP